MSVSRPELYADQILSLLFTEPGLSRADLAERLGVDRGNITRIVRKLLDRGLLEQGLPDKKVLNQETAAPSGAAVTGTTGRRKIPLRINDRELCFLGVELQGEGISVCGVSPYGEVLGIRRSPVDAGGTGKLLTGSIIRAIQAGKDKMEDIGRRVLGVGVGISGLVDPSGGRILYSEDLGIKTESLELQLPLERELKLPVGVDNDARCCCYDVMTYGAFSHRRDFVYLFCEIEENPEDFRVFSRFALGSALVLEGQLRYGSHSTAGEFRSILTPGDIPGQFAPSLENEIKGIRSNPEGRSRILLELSQHLGFLANYLDLEAIFLGGGIEEYRQEMMPLLEEAVRATWLYAGRYPKPVDIHFAGTGDKPALRGAAALIARRIFCVS